MLGSRAEATPITYIETVTASGSIGPLGFQSDLITITATADTTGITSPNAGELAVNNLSATVNVAGVGTFGFTSPTNTFDFQTGTGTAGENSGTTGVPGSDILDVASAVFTTYDLATSLGPVSGEPVYQFGRCIPDDPLRRFRGGIRDRLDDRQRDLPGDFGHARAFVADPVRPGRPGPGLGRASSRLIATRHRRHGAAEISAPCQNGRGFFLRLSLRPLLCRPPPHEANQMALTAARLHNTM